MLGVGIGLGQILALHIDALEGAIDGGIKHVGIRRPGSLSSGAPPEGLEHGAGGIIRNVPVAGQFMREGPISQAPCTLFWPRSGFTPTPRRPRLPVPWRGLPCPSPWLCPGYVRSRQALIDRAIATLGEKPRRGTDVLRRNTGDGFQGFRRILRCAMKPAQS